MDCWHIDAWTHECESRIWWCIYSSIPRTHLFTVSFPGHIYSQSHSQDTICIMHMLTDVLGCTLSWGSPSQLGWVLQGPGEGSERCRSLPLPPHPAWYPSPPEECVYVYVCVCMLCACVCVYVCACVCVCVCVRVLCVSCVCMCVCVCMCKRENVIGCVCMCSWCACMCVCVCFMQREMVFYSPLLWFVKLKVDSCPFQPTHLYHSQSWWWPMVTFDLLISTTHRVDGGPLSDLLQDVCLIHPQPVWLQHKRYCILWHFIEPSALEHLLPDTTMTQPWHNQWHNHGTKYICSFSPIKLPSQSKYLVPWVMLPCFAILNCHPTNQPVLTQTLSLHLAVIAMATGFSSESAYYLWLH